MILVCLALAGTSAAAADLELVFAESGARIGSPEDDWQFDLTIAGWGARAAMIPVRTTGIHSVSDRVEFDLLPVALTGWVAPTPGGLVYGLSLAHPPGVFVDERGPLLDLSIDGNVGMRLSTVGDEVEIVAFGEVVARLGPLHARTANGKAIDARWRLVSQQGGTQPRIAIDAIGDAYYPLTVEFVAARSKTAVEVSAGNDDRSEPRSPLAPPANDLCSGAESIPAAGPFPYLSAVTADITDAATVGDPPRPGCQGSISRSIWYSFTPSVTAEYTIATCAGFGAATTVDDTVLQVYTSGTGDCNSSFARVTGGCDDDGCSVETTQAVVRNLPLEAGERYFFVVWKFGTGAPAAGDTAVQLLVEQNLPPLNDRCDGAVVVALESPIEGSNNAATNDYQLTDMSCFGGVGHLPTSVTGRDTVYSFTAPDDDSYSFRAQNTESGGNLAVHVASSCPAAPPTQDVVTCLSAANRNTSPATFSAAEEVFCLPLSSGEELFLFVDEAVHASVGGAYTLEIDRCTREHEPNDSPSEPDALSCGVEGTISPSGDADFYALGAPVAGSRVFSLADGVAANSADIDMRITTSADTLEYDDDNNDVAFGSSSPNVAGTPLTGEAAFVRIDHFSPTVRAEPYRLYTVVQPSIDAATPESEPNDTPAEANTAPHPYFRGSLPFGDVDVFGFEALAGDLIYLGLDGDPLRDKTPIEPDLALLDANGALLARVDDFASGSATDPGTGSLTAQSPSSPAEGLVWRARASGIYYAHVASSSTGDYLLSIAIGCGEPEADLSVTKTDSPDPVVTGTTLTFSMQVTNAGPAVAAPVTLTDSIPANTTFRSVSVPTGWSCSLPPIGGSGIVECTTPGLAVGVPAQLLLNVAIDDCIGDGSIIENTATVTAGVTDPDPQNNSATTTTSVSDPGSCDDGDPTTCADVCVAGGCQGSPVPEPPPIGDSVRLSIVGGTTTISWNDPPGDYNAYRGTIDPGPYDQSCLNSAGPISGSSVNDDSEILPDETYYYLITRLDSCRESISGTDSSGAPRPNADPCVP